MKFSLALIALLVAVASAAPNATCTSYTASSSLPSSDTLRGTLTSVMQSQGYSANAWAVVVDRYGRIVDVAFSGVSASVESISGRVFAAMKAYTAVFLSSDAFAVSSANFYGLSQPGSTYFGLNTVLVPNMQLASAGCVSSYGTSSDSLIGEILGGLVGVAGGLPLYDNTGLLIGAIGVASNSSCADHLLAWRMRHQLSLDWLPTGYHGAWVYSEVQTVSTKETVINSTTTNNVTFTNTATSSCNRTSPFYNETDGSNTTVGSNSTSGNSTSGGSSGHTTTPPPPPNNQTSTNSTGDCVVLGNPASGHVNISCPNVYFINCVVNVTYQLNHTVQIQTIVCPPALEHTPSAAEQGLPSNTPTSNNIATPTANTTAGDDLTSETTFPYFQFDNVTFNCTVETNSTVTVPGITEFITNTTTTFILYQFGGYDNIGFSSSTVSPLYYPSCTSEEVVLIEQLPSLYPISHALWAPFLATANGSFAANHTYGITSLSTYYI